MIEVVYNALKAHLAQSVQDLKVVEYYLGQGQDGTGPTLRATPAAFIEFAPIDWVQYGASHIQKARLEFTVILITASVYDDDKRLVDPANNHLDLVKQIYQVLQGQYFVSGPKTIAETITRTRTTVQHSFEGFVVTNQTFQTNVFDYTAYQPNTPIQLNQIGITVNV